MNGCFESVTAKLMGTVTAVVFGSTLIIVAFTGIISPSLEN
jgi:hypothetical protein